MFDQEYRIMLTGDHKGVENVGIFYVDEDGQVSIVDAWEVAPFDTKRQLMEDILRRITRHRTKVGARLS